MLDEEKGQFELDLPRLSDSLILKSSFSEPLVTSLLVKPVRRAKSLDIQPRHPQQREINRIVSWRMYLPMPLIRQISINLSQPRVIEVFYCNICLENHDQNDAFTLDQCHQHQFCKASLNSYLTSQIQDGILSYPCPLSSECNGNISEREVQQLVDIDTFARFKRFQAMKNKGYRECPKCGNSTIGNESNVEMVCESCGEKFCFLHHNAHPTMTCAQYIRWRRREELANERAIKRMARKCPSCMCETEKSGGCNHMKCRQCGQVKMLHCTQSYGGRGGGTGGSSCKYVSSSVPSHSHSYCLLTFPS
jgi:hypothetical protein